MLLGARASYGLLWRGGARGSVSQTLPLWSAGGVLRGCLPEPPWTAAPRTLATGGAAGAGVGRGGIGARVRDAKALSRAPLAKLFNGRALLFGGDRFLTGIQLALRDNRFAEALSGACLK